MNVRAGHCRRGDGRAGFTILEVSVATGALVVGMLLVAQTAIWSLAERGRTAARREALEVATNVLETARALPWRDLTPEWAAAQRLPGDLAERLADGKLTVRVTPEATRPATKRVAVEVTWSHTDGAPGRPVRLVGLFSDRSAEAPGGKP
jgi:hypothetical protein